MKKKASVCWFCTSNLEKAITNSIFLETKLKELKSKLRVDLIIFDRTKNEFRSKENVIKLSSNRYKVISHKDTPHQIEYLKLFSFSKSKYILPLTDDDDLDCVGFIDFISKLEIKGNSSIVIAIPKINQTGIDLGKLKPNNNYDFWEYQKLRSYNIAYWSAISTPKLIKASKAFADSGNLIWLHPYWDQCLIWAISSDSKKSIKVIEGFYLKYDLGNWSNKNKSLETINSMTPKGNTTEGLAIRDIMTYKKFSIRNFKEYLRWLYFLLNRNYHYRRSFPSLIKAILSMINVIFWKKKFRLKHKQK